MNTLRAKNTSISVRVIGLLALVFIIGTQAATAQEPTKVLPLLHGMNSSPDTWNDFVALKFNNSCAIIANGALTDNSTPNPQGVLCYRVRFGSFDLRLKKLGFLLGIASLFATMVWLHLREEAPPASVSPLSRPQLGSAYDPAFDPVLEGLNLPSSAARGNERKTPARGGGEPSATFDSVDAVVE